MYKSEKTQGFQNIILIIAELFANIKCLICLVVCLGLWHINL